MADKTPNQHIGAIYTIVADTQKEFADLSIAMIALQSALRDLIPELEARYAAHMGDAKVREAKSEFERKIHVLRELARQMPKS